MNALMSFVLLASASWTLHTNQQAERMEADRTQTIAVVQSTGHLLSHIKDAETGQRGYLLTSDPKYLEPFNSGLVSVEKDMREIHVLCPAKAYEQVSVLVRNKTDELRETIRLHDSGDRDDAITIVKSDQGKRYMDDLRIVLGELHSQGDKAMREAEASTVLQRKVSTGFFILTLALSVLFPIVGAQIIIKNNQSDNKAISIVRNLKDTQAEWRRSIDDDAKPR